MRKNKIGVGLITYNRPEYYEQCLSSLPKNKIDELIVVKDGGGVEYKDFNKNYKNIKKISFLENGGNCRSKNAAFAYLLGQDCNHIFLIEDDMLILDNSVFEQYIETAYRTGIYHLMFLKVDNNIIHKRAVIDGIDLHKNPQGSFMYALDSVIKIVGEWDMNFKNAFTHVDWTYRVFLKGLLTPFWWFPDVENSQFLIKEIEGSTKNSSISSKETFKENVKESMEYFIKKYGYYTKQIPDNHIEQVKKRMEFLKKNYARTK